MDLITAAQRGDVDGVRSILGRPNVNVNFQDRYGNTALIVAAVWNKVGIVEILLEREAITEIKNDIGRTALHEAAALGHVDVARLLLDHGARIDSRTMNGNTPLMLACSDGHFDVVRLLAARGGAEYINTRNTFYMTALIYAIHGGYVNIIQFLVSFRARLNDCDVFHNTALHRAMLGAHIVRKEVVQTLVDLGADVDVENVHGKTALVIAAEIGHVPIVEILCRAGTLVGLDAFGDIQNARCRTLMEHQQRKTIISVMMQHLARTGVRSPLGRMQAPELYRRLLDMLVGKS